MSFVRIGLGVSLWLVAAGVWTPLAAPAQQIQLAANNAIPQDLNALTRLMMQLYQTSRYTEALALAPVFVSRMRQRYGDRSLQYANALGLVGLIQQSTNHLKEAVESLETALPIFERRGGANGALATTAKVGLAQTYQDLNRLDDAERILREVAAAAEARGNADAVAEASSTLSTVLVEKAQFADAEALAKRAADIWSKSGDTDKMTTALGNLATVYQSERRLSEAEQIYLRIIPIQEKQGPQGAEGLTRMLGNLANVYGDEGRYAETEQTERRVLARFESMFGPNDPNVARALTNMAITFSDQRKDHEAELVLNRALQIDEKAYGPDNPNLARTLFTLGNAMGREGHYPDAEPLFRRAVAISEKSQGPDNPELARYLNSLAIAVAVEGHEDESTQILKRVLAIGEKVFGPSSVELAPALNNLGKRAMTAKRYEEAETLFRRSLGVTRSTQTPSPERLAFTLDSLGEIKIGQGKPVEAEAFYRDALATDEKAFGPEFPKCASLRSKMGVAAGRQGDWQRALDLTRVGYGIAIRSSERLGRSSQSAAGSAELLAYVSRDLASADWQASLKDAGQASKLQDEAFGAAQRTNTSSAASALAEMSARFGAGSGAMAALVRQQQDLGSQAQALDKALIAALGLTDPKGRDVKIANLRTLVAAVDAHLAEINTRIAHDFPNYAELSDPKPMAIADVQKLLALDEVLVTWLVRNDQTIVWAITKDGSKWQSVDIPYQQLDEMIAKLRSGLDLDTVTRGLTRGEAGRDLVFDLATAHSLYEKLLAPVASQLAGKTRIVEVPVWSLTSLPLQLLLTDAPRRSATSMSDPLYRDAAWLAKSYAVTVIPSVSSLRSLRVFTQASSAPKPLAGFADPVFSRVPTEGGKRGQIAAQRKIQALSHYYRGGAVDLDSLREGLPALPETADELRTVARDLAADTSDLKIGEAASVATVKSMPLDQYRVVYFATHGLVAGDVGGLSEPALALTIPPHPTEADSGLLKASDVGQLKLNADWVVLSACNTAAGDKPGAEGLSGLTRAFFYAGARALLVSNWSVRSDAAVDLTTHTFAKMAATPGLGRSEALRQSMLELIASGDDHAYPAVWAPFMVVGEGGSAR